jgi:hypothetical protein
MTGCCIQEDRRTRVERERKRRDKRRDTKKEIRRIRVRLNVEIQRRRTAVKSYLQVGVPPPPVPRLNPFLPPGPRRLSPPKDVRRAHSLFHPSAPQAASEQEEQQVKVSKRGLRLMEDTELGGFEQPLPPPKRRRVGSEESILESDKLSGVLQLWDFLCSFAGMFTGLKTIPSLAVLMDALATADRVVHRQPTAKEQRRIDLLTDIAVALTSVLVPDVVRTLTGLGTADAIPHLPCNVMTWRELARTAFLIPLFQVTGTLEVATNLRGPGCKYSSVRGP